MRGETQRWSADGPRTSFKDAFAFKSARAGDQPAPVEDEQMIQTNGSGNGCAKKLGFNALNGADGATQYEDYFAADGQKVVTRSYEGIDHV